MIDKIEIICAGIVYIFELGALVLSFGMLAYLADEWIFKKKK